MLDYASEPGDDVHRKLRLLKPSNTTVKFSLDLGYKGYVAYCQAFSRLKAGLDWQLLAAHFIRVVREVEKERGMSVRLPSESMFLCLYLNLDARLSLFVSSVCRRILISRGLYTFPT
jgi:hypothetical protein